MVIPTEYLLPGDYILRDKAVIVNVEVGVRTSEWVEILSGIDDSTKILLPN